MEEAQKALRPEAGTRAERKWIKAERKKLRSDLKEKGITSRIDFENIARELGLVLDEGKKARWLNFWLLNWKRFLSSLGLKSIFIAAAATLSLLFLVSAISEEAGAFTINLTASMLKAGFILSETQDFQREEARLFSQEIQNVNNITLEDISRNVDNIDGPHNENSYIAYTFYIKNIGQETASYAYYLNLDSFTKGVGEAIWVMLFEDGRQAIYAMESKDGNAEELYGFWSPPFGDEAYSYDEQYYEEDGRYGLKTISFVDKKTVMQGLVEDVEVGEAHKYTVVIWVEGYDPECTNDIFGGYAKLSMAFELISNEDTKNIFDGVFRTEYHDFISSKVSEN